MRTWYNVARQDTAASKAGVNREALGMCGAHCRNVARKETGV